MTISNKIDGFTSPHRTHIPFRNLVQGWETSRREIYSGSKLDWEQTVKITKGVQKFLKTHKVRLKFSVHEETGNIVVTVINAANDRIIRRIPSEEIISFAEQIENGLHGLCDVEV